MESRGRRPLTDSEVVSMTEALGAGEYGARNQAMFTLGIQTGFRISEILQVTLADIVQGGEIVVDLVMLAKYRKGGRESLAVWLPAKTRAALALWIRQLKRYGYSHRRDLVFQNRHNDNHAISYAYAAKIIKTAAAKASVNGRVGTHSMRKTFADRFYNHCKAKVAQGVILDPLAETQQALGHRDAASTIAYMGLHRQNTRRLTQEIFGE